MVEISIALVLIAGIAGYLVNKYLDQRQQELDEKRRLNTDAADAALSAAVAEMHKQFDDRINKTWGTINSTRQELDAFKLQIGIKGMNNAR